MILSITMMMMFNPIAVIMIMMMLMILMITVMMMMMMVILSITVMMMMIMMTKMILDRHINTRSLGVPLRSNFSLEAIFQNKFQI